MSDETKKDDVKSTDQPTPDEKKTGELPDKDLDKVSGGFHFVKTVDKSSPKLYESS